MKKKIRTRKMLLLTLVCFLFISILPIEAEAASAKLNVKKKTLEVGESYQLKVTGVKGSIKWSSSKTKVATVSAGKVKAKAPGSTTITAKVGKKKFTCKVTVKKSSYASAYKAYLKKHKNYKYYKMHDINGDGVKELLCANSYSSDAYGNYIFIDNEYGFRVYTYANRKMKYVGTVATGYITSFQYNKTGIIADMSTGYGASSYMCSYYTLTGSNKLKEQTITSMCGYLWWLDKEIEEYTLNSKNVSKRTYNTYYNRFHKGAKPLVLSKNRF